MIEMKLVSAMFYAQMYGCIVVSHRVHTVIHTKDALHTGLYYFILSASFLYAFFTLQNPRIVSFIACKVTECD